MRLYEERPTAAAESQVPRLQSAGVLVPERDEGASSGGGWRAAGSLDTRNGATRGAEASTMTAAWLDLLPWATPEELRTLIDSEHAAALYAGALSAAGISAARKESAPRISGLK